MRCTFSARFTTWNQVAKARTRSRASAGARSRTQAASSARASREPARPRIAATRSSSTSSNSCSPPCSRSISPISAPSACTSSRSGSCLGGKWMSLRFNSVSPAGGFRGEVGALRTHYAEALPGGRLPDVPTLERADAARAEFLQAPHLRLDVVALDVEMHAALVLYLLYFEMRLVGVGAQNAIERLLVRCRTHRQVQRCRPETRRRIHIVGAAVDDESGEATLVHGLILCGAVTGVLVPVSATR